ncbi:MAG TPA: RsmD family RNA methyltransferase, partial [Vicingus sp.]|nr:RsmD family RNA methyltransferase [Vicingus sp.]
MRIISGIHKGKAIQAPKNLPVRPTTDFAKEALFNIIENNFEIDELDVLDLFAGTGNITYEFASRGAKTVTSIDQNSNCYNFIKRTTKELNFDSVQVFRADVFKFL